MGRAAARSAIRRFNLDGKGLRRQSPEKLAATL
jgi:hypothetical protein